MHKNCDTGKIIIWDIGNGEKLETLKIHNGLVLSLAVSLASVSRAKQINKIWNTINGTLRKSHKLCLFFSCSTN